MKLGKALKTSFASGLIGLAGLVNSGCAFESEEDFERRAVLGVFGGLADQHAAQTGDVGPASTMNFLQQSQIAQDGRNQNNINQQVYTNNGGTQTTNSLQSNPGYVDTMGITTVKTAHGEIIMRTCERWIDFNKNSTVSEEEMIGLGKTQFYEDNRKFGFAVQDLREPHFTIETKVEGVASTGPTSNYEVTGKNLLQIYDFEGNLKFEYKVREKSSLIIPSKESPEISFSPGKYFVVWHKDQYSLKVEFEVLSKN